MGRQALRNGTPDRVEIAARLHADDQSDGLDGIGLRRGKLQLHRVHGDA